jgi:ferredoxin-NADP reductase
MNSTLNRLSQWFLHHSSFAAYIEPVVQRFKPAWRANLFRAEVVNIIAVQEDYLELILKPEPTWTGFLAGQHIELTVEMNGRLVTRVFTIASDPNQFRQSGVIRLLMRVNRDGQFTRALRYFLQKGSWCNISAAKGEFVYQASAKPALLVAGGSGITPFLAMLSVMLDCQQQPVTLIYFAKAGSHVALDELRALAGRFAHFHFQLAKRENVEVVERLMAVDPATDVYCCGPVGLMKTIRDFAHQYQRTYYQEQFGLVQNLSSSPASDFQVSLDGHVVSTSNQDSLLNQLEAKQLPVIRGCGMGICHQCQCLKKSGVVRDLRTGERSAQGEMLIQLCVVVPESDLELSL